LRERAKEKPPYEAADDENKNCEKPTYDSERDSQQEPSKSVKNQCRGGVLEAQPDLLHRFERSNCDVLQAASC